MVDDAQESGWHRYDPAEGHGLRHDPFNSIVGPRPIGWIGSRAADETPNLAPYSFFNAFNYTPPIVGFASTGWKHSAANIAATGSFTWNLVDRSTADAMNRSAATVGPEIDEFSLAGVSAVPGEVVDAPRVEQSTVSFECRLLQQIRLHDLERRPVDTWLTLGQVVRVHIRRFLIRDGVFDTAAAAPVLRAGGPSAYVAVTPESFFHMRRPD
ncbi:flavin reductase family protein [Rhizosaccharibacter radicis]|uniref:Flavin reductase family protein n=1 Tax=Rhizosaccharibacter radicis TaxID=2782605 RepID=A0ABT1VUZ9_9PROT|nr:flavin reductase family protein [Acetobacteraceae bacterium KSS12]